MSPSPLFKGKALRVAATVFHQRKYAELLVLFILLFTHEKIWSFFKFTVLQFYTYGPANDRLMA